MELLQYLEVKDILPRKITASSLAGPLFALFSALLLRYPWGEIVTEYQSDIQAFAALFAFYLMFGFPVILIYGVAASIVSDKIANFLYIRSNDRKLEFLVSCSLHLVFGLILFPYSLVASILFFVTDRLLHKRKVSPLQALLSLLIPLTLWLTCFGIISIQ